MNRIPPVRISPVRGDLCYIKLFIGLSVRRLRECHPDRMID